MSSDRLKFRALVGSTESGYRLEYSKGRLHDFFKEFEGEPITQWTGLVDGDGVEIYEGDIVCIDKDRFGPGRHEIWSVVYGYFGDAAYYAQNHLNSGRLLEIDIYTAPGEVIFTRGGEDDVIVCKVLGNIYEDRELLDA